MHVRKEDVTKDVAKAVKSRNTKYKERALIVHRVHRRNTSLGWRVIKVVEYAGEGRCRREAEIAIVKHPSP